MPIERRLGFPDKFVYELSEDVDTEISTSSDVATFPDNTTQTLLNVSWSQAEYTRILSALLVGAELTYPFQSQQIYYDFMRLKNSMTCEQIIDCIENDADTRLSLQIFLTQNGYGTGSGTYDTPTIYTNNPLLADGSQIPSCGNDNLFGAITQLIDFMNSVLTDIFERIEAGSNYLERTQILLSGVPGIGLLPLDEFVDFADNVISALGENYVSQYTSEIRDEYRCDLFCLCKDTCELDFQAWSEYFMSKVGSAISSENLSDGLEWFITGVWEGTQVVHAAHALMCDILAYGSKFFDLDPTYLSRVITSAMNDPDSDWTTLCEDCLPVNSHPAIVTPCYGGGSAGILEDLGNGRWRVTSTARATDRGITLGSSISGIWHLANGQSFGGNSTFYGYHVNGQSCGASASPPNHDTNPMLEFGWFASLGSADLVYEFDFIDGAP